MSYKLVLGLEIHFHVKAQKKMFCGCAANFYDEAPNTYVCPVCLGLPGALPVPNEEAIRKVQLLGTALNCELNEFSRFDRKHYFYPDLPKGYQISQYLQPLCGEGYLELASGKKIEIERIHMEEDTAKSMHIGDKTLVDFNKSGLPLGELVTKPVFTTVEDAVEFCKKLQDIIKLLGVGDANMEKGQLRLEANISLRTEEMEKAGKLPNYKVEIKNINSFRFMEKAVRAEIKRQQELLESGQAVLQENRGYNEKTGETVAQRSKEEAHDYRYFPEPDIPPMEFSREYFERLQEELPELPAQKSKKLMDEYALSAEYAGFLSQTDNMNYYLKFLELVESLEPKKVANILKNRLDLRDLEISEILKTLEEENDKISDTSELEGIVEKVISANPKAVEDFKSGNENAVMFLVGQVMRETKGKADAGVVKDLLKKVLSA